MVIGAASERESREEGVMTFAQCVVEDRLSFLLAQSERCFDRKGGQKFSLFFLALANESVKTRRKKAVEAHEGDRGHVLEGWERRKGSTRWRRGAEEGISSASMESRDCQHESSVTIVLQNLLELSGVRGVGARGTRCEPSAARFKTIGPRNWTGAKEGTDRGARFELSLQPRWS